MAPLPAAELVAVLDADGSGLSDLELNVVAHAWAHDHATPLDIVAVDVDTGGRLAEARDRMVASCAGIVAMKATTIPLRASSRPEKRASDLYDLARVVVAGALSSEDLRRLPDVLLAPVLERLQGWFVDDAGRDRTYREVRRFDRAADRPRRRERRRRGPLGGRSALNLHAEIGAARLWYRTFERGGPGWGRAAPPGPARARPRHRAARRRRRPRRVRRRGSDAAPAPRSPRRPPSRARPRPCRQPCPTRSTPRPVGCRPGRSSRRAPSGPRHARWPTRSWTRRGSSSAAS
ncbi:MAG: hypothetical protein R2746_14895 [Acidimicrobiales bacterium]